MNEPPTIPVTGPTDEERLMNHFRIPSITPRRLLVAIACGAATITALSVDAPVADAATACKYSASYGRSLGPSYVTSITVSRDSCANAKKVVRTFHSCRIKNGGKSGRCASSASIRGYRCTENRGKPFQGQFSSKVACKRGSRSVVSTYSQFV